MPEGFYARHGKRWLDAAAAGLLLVLLSPLLAGVALAVRIALGPGVLFRQERAGRGGVPFTLFKFRSMRAPRFAGEPDAARLTRFGRLLRASALDEAPQLLNVLRGEMSLVGPRPLPMDYLPRYTPRQAERLRVRPGLAGLAQARGRNAVPWPARLEWDARYAAAVTARGDLAAVLGTLRVLLSGRGVNAPGHATMPELPPRNPRDTRRLPGRPHGNKPGGHPDRTGAHRSARRGRAG
ncbi:sugar transferase [Roseomonas populi]|uniref:Sugar transferase n=1 Tax=Roseomonas populi TaxID=3121582 RepID=A0ABT1X1H6_9PROT|nr:sugar transferase [Roseomonas pecuniae]MCR0981953.1 sugar transferase [Roseomonas pecuniae]